MSETYYHILGIPTDADEREIKRAYHRLARELHPDKASSPEKARELEHRFALISTAYNTLKDAAQRQEYDRRVLGSRKNAAADASKSATPTAAVMTASRGGSSTSLNNEGMNSSRSGGGDRSLTPERAGIAQKAYVKGFQLMKQKEFAKAAEFFDAAVANNPNEAAYHAQLAMALIGARKSASRAIESMQRAIELDKYNLDFKFNLAQIYETIGSTSNAVRVYEEILKWDAENEMARQMLRTIQGKKNGLFGKLKAPPTAPAKKKTAPSGGFLDSLLKKFSK